MKITDFFANHFNDHPKGEHNEHCDHAKVNCDRPDAPENEHYLVCDHKNLPGPKPMQDHNWDCAACGAPCKAEGHDPCPRSSTGKCTQTWRCWNHSLKKITSGAPSVSIVRTVPERVIERERRLPSWVQDEDGHVGPPKQPSRSWMPNRNWTPAPKPLRPVPGPKKTLPKAKPIDADLAALIDNEADKVDDTLRERVEKGDV